MNIDELKSALERMSVNSHKGYDRAIGPRGGHCTASDFYMGSYATIDCIIESIGKDDLSILKKWD